MTAKVMEKLEKAGNDLQACKDANVPYRVGQGVVIFVSALGYVTYGSVIVLAAIFAPEWVAYVVAALMGYPLWAMTTRVRWLWNRVKNIYSE